MNTETPDRMAAVMQGGTDSGAMERAGVNISIGQTCSACAERIEDAYRQAQNEVLAALQRVADGDHGETQYVLSDAMLRLRWLNERRLPSAVSITNARRLEKLGREAWRFAWKMRFRFKPGFLASELWHAVCCYVRAVIARTIAAVWSLLGR